MRWSLGLSLRAVHRISLKLARKLRNERFVLTLPRLHEIETKGRVPSIHRMYTLAHIYGCSLAELMRLYGVPRA
jgi:hypothetical protein